MGRGTVFNKVLGSLVGFAIGDAMGATTEFMNSGAIREKYGQVTTILGGGWLDLEPGEVTDDTQMMILVAESYNMSLKSSLTEHPLTLEECCCRKFTEWYMTNPKDIGNTIRTVISSCFGKSEEEWLKFSEQLNHNYPSRGNGSLMRCLYPAILGDEEAAVAQGLLTHNNEEVSTYITSYTRILQRNLNSTVTSHRGSAIIKHEPKGTAEDTFINAVYWSSQGSFKEALIGAVNDGGDADTIAALTGGLAGAHFGFHNIPSEWVKKLNEESYTQLRELAEKATTIILQEESI